MREIKFRYYDTHAKKMVNWHEAKLLRFVQFQIISANVMMSIGIQDKKGVDIYEGDYLVDYYPIDEEDDSKGLQESLMPVVWCEKKLQWCVDASYSRDGSFLTSLCEYFGENLEVKGNIYEN
jgi:hypothetical protein